MLYVGIVASYSGIDGHWMWHEVLCLASHIIILSHFLKWFLFLEKQIAFFALVCIFWIFLFYYPTVVVFLG